MPELPEVETIIRALRQHIVGLRVEGVSLSQKRLRFPYPPNFRKSLVGRRIEGVERRAKYILVRLDGGAVWLIHLGMSGRLHILPDGEKPESLAKHGHCQVHFSNGQSLLYVDPRRFGFMSLVADDVPSPYLVGLGPEPFDSVIGVRWFMERVGKLRTPIKNLLLNQRFMVGLGNIYVCEALFRARIAPQRPACSLTRAEVKALLPAIRAVLREAIGAGGSSLRDFADIEGKPGYFHKKWRVYNQKGKPCLHRGCSGRIAALVLAGRNSFYCPSCQK